MKAILFQHSIFICCEKHVIFNAKFILLKRIQIRYNFLNKNKLFPPKKLFSSIYNLESCLRL